MRNLFYAGLLIIVFILACLADEVIIDGREYSIFDVSEWDGMSAPSVSPSGSGRAYFDSTANTLKLSQNGGAYSDFLTSSTGDSTYLKQDGSTPLTADWNMGAFDLTGGVDATFSGTVQTKDLTVTDLTSGRIPYITTGGAFIDTANLGWNPGTSTLSTGSIDLTGTLTLGTEAAIVLPRTSDYGYRLGHSGSATSNGARGSFYPQNADSGMTFYVIPKGTSGWAGQTSFSLFNTDFVADSTNYERLHLAASKTYYYMDVMKAGTGTNLYPFYFRMDGTTVINIGTDGNIRMGGTSAATNAVSIDLDDKIDFGDNAVYIWSDDDGYLDLTADTGIRFNGVAGVSGTYNFYNDGTSGNVTQIVVTNGIITSVTEAP